MTAEKSYSTLEANDIAEQLSSLSENDRKQAYALIQGMVIGKELAEQKDTA